MAQSESEKVDRTEQFLSLVTPIQGKLFGYILSRWLNRADAEDIHQSVIATMWKKFDQYQPGTDFHAWAFTISHYELCNFKKKQIKNPIQFNEDVQQVLEASEDDFIENLDVRIDAMNKCLKKLGVHQRKLIELKYVQEVPAKRIADRFGLSSRAIYQAISRIHKVLMRCIRRTLAEEACHGR